MKHLDEGTLQAWLDMPRSGLDASEVAEIEGHLAVCDACAAELEALRGSDESVHALLAGGLDRDIERPPFDEVVARAQGLTPGAGGGAEAGGDARAGGTDPRRGLSRLNRLAWAASIVVALGVGWMTNEIYRSGPPSPTSRVPVEPAAEPAAEVAAEAPSPAPTDEVQAEAAPRAGRLEEAERIVQPPPPAPSVTGDGDVPTALTDDRADVGVGAAVAPSAPEPSAQPELRYERQRAAADAGARDTFADAGAAAAAPRVEETTSQADQAALAGPRPIVRGVVRNAADGQPISSVQVYVEELNVGALTGPDGSYTLSLPPGDSMEVDLVVQRIGYRPETRELEVAGGATTVADFTLQEEAVRLEEVVVTGTVGQAQRRALGNAVESAEAAPFAWQPATPEVAESVLGRSPLTVPDLVLLSVDFADVPDGAGARVVRVRQQLSDGGFLTLVEGASDASREGWSVPSEGALASARVGRLLVTATAPVSADALQELLGRVR